MIIKTVKRTSKVILPLKREGTGENPQGKFLEPVLEFFYGSG